MIEILKILNEKTNGKYNFLTLKTAVFNPNTADLDVVFIYPEDMIINTEMKNEIEFIVATMLSGDIKVNIKYKKNYLDENILKEALINYIRKEFPALSLYEIKSINTEENIVSIEINDIMKDYITAKNLNEQLINFIKGTYHQDYTINIEMIGEDITCDEPEVFLTKEIKKPKFIDVKNVEAFIGDKIEDKPIYIRNIKEPAEFVVLCGKIKFFAEYETKPKELKDGKIRPPKKYFRFKLEDFTGEIAVIVFPTQTNLPKMQKLANGSEIVISGAIEEDNFKGGLVLRPKQINFCTLPREFVEEFDYKTENDEYIFIKPETYQQLEQIDLFAESETRAVGDYLKNNTVVVFDFETTGLDYLSSKIIELGAVKIENGKIVSTFSCFVNPETPIPQEITKITGITDRDVKDAYTYKDILQDFYKYTRGCVLVAYNIDFDYKFLNHYGKICGYNFNNEQKDAYALAMKTIKGLRNYKLKTVATHLGVSLDNAHRAVQDALATAEVFIKLIELI